MLIEKLTIGANLKGRTSGKVRQIEDYSPATPLAVQQWKVNGDWFNYAQLDARYTLYNPSGRTPKNKKKVGATEAL